MRAYINTGLDRIATSKKKIEVNIPNLNDNINNNTNGQLEKEINNLRFEFKDYMNQIEKNLLYKL